MCSPLLGRCTDPTTKSYNNGTSGIFNPGFPATCSYVTAQVKTEIDLATLATGTQLEIACETVIYSGRGFSNCQTTRPMP